MLCILYTIALGWSLGLIGLLVERALPPTAPRRWIWCVAIALSILTPATYQAKHSMPVAAEVAGDPSWWALLGTYDGLIAKLWMATSALLFAWGLFNVLRITWLVSRRRQTVIDGVPVVVTDSLGPAAVGFWSTRVVVPRWVLAMPGAQRKYVLQHETEHRKAHDTHLLFITSLTLIMTPWNVALWWQLRRLSLAVEVDCDNRVVRALGNPALYGNLLFAIGQATSHGPRLQPGLLGKGMLERRLMALLAPAQLSRAMRCLLPVLAIGLLVGLLSIPHPVLNTGAHTTHHSVAP
jgi:hypothetical protein